MTNQTFLETIKPYVLHDMRNTAILASLTASQALIESGHGDSGLAKQANNLFGIKGTYNGQFITMPTREWDSKQGKYIVVQAKFRKYPTFKESINDHSAMFLRMSRYQNLKCVTDYKTACKLVQQDGYATEPSYTQILIKTIEQYKLYEWDLQCLEGTSLPHFARLLKTGCKGTDVKILQKKLVEYGYRIMIDGIFGKQTLNAVADFQRTHDLIPDGIAGPRTIEKLWKQ